MKAGREVDGRVWASVRQDKSGRWIAIEDGEVIASAPSHADLVTILQARVPLLAALKANGIDV